MPTDTPETRVAVVESRLDNHEKVCSERYEAIAESLKDLGSGQKQNMIGVIAILLTVLGYVFVNWAPWAKVPH